jgi:hypothetical protein
LLWAAGLGWAVAAADGVWAAVAPAGAVVGVPTEGQSKVGSIKGDTQQYRSTTVTLDRVNGVTLSTSLVTRSCFKLSQDYQEASKMD